MMHGLTEHGMLAATRAYAETQKVFSEPCTVSMYLRVEKALARSLARAGLINSQALQAIEEACDPQHFDMAAWQQGTARVGYPIVPLVDQLAAVSGPAGHAVHLGATTQDIMDTALVLQVRRAGEALLSDLTRVCQALGELAQMHRATLMAGRSKFQHALPVTFGYKAAVWLDMLHRRLQSLKIAYQQTQVLQFGGAVGTLAALGSEGSRVRDCLAQELDLAAPDITWHVSRDRFAELVHALLLVNLGLGKIALDVAHLMSTEVAEVHEPYSQGRGTSSTMPQKRNPVLSEAILDAASGASAGASLVNSFMLQGHERSLGGSYTERRAVSDAFLYASGATELAFELLRGLEVHAEQMKKNLQATQGLVMAESVMMALVDKVGRHQAHHILHDACLSVAQTGKSLSEVLSRQGQLGPNELDAALNPAMYLGVTEKMIDDVLRSTKMS